MRVVIYGAGAVGGVIGTRLIQHGHAVVLIARGEHLRAMQEQGLHFQSPTEDEVIPVTAVGHPGEITFTPDDVVLLTMKSQHTPGALADLRRAAGDRVPVVCAQNGVANEREALRYFRDVYAMLVMLPASHLEPGSVATESVHLSGILDTGRFPGGLDDRIIELAELLAASRFSCNADATVMRWKYAKMLMNLNNALGAVSGAGEEVADIGRQMRHEALACYEAAGIECASAQEVRDRRSGVMELGTIGGKARSGSSSWQSLARGTGNIEADHLNGEIVQLGRLHGIPTPANAVLQRLANRVAEQGHPPGSVPADDVRALIAAETDAEAEGR